MAFCHGKGQQGGSHCCWVNGAECPLLLKQIDGHIWINGVDQGTTTTYINSLTNNGAARANAQKLAQGVNQFCLAAVKVIMAQPALLNNRAGFEAAWNAQADYVAQVRPHWVAVEERLDLPIGGYNCSTWKGGGVGQCCFGEDTPTNEVNAAPLDATVVVLRRAGGV